MCGKIYLMGISTKRRKMKEERRCRKISPGCKEAERTHLKVKLAKLLLGVDVCVSRDDYGTGGERHSGVR